MKLSSPRFLGSDPAQFALWLRSGLQTPDIAAPDGVERKFNPYHDPDNGRFTFAPGGRASARPAGAEWVLPHRDGARPDLRSIERHFQVRRDDMTVWPKVGSYSVPGVEPQPVTVTEVRMLNNLGLSQGLDGLLEFNSIAKRAMAKAAAAYPAATQIPPMVEAQIQRMPPAKAVEARRGWPTNDGHRDAFRHAYWSATLAQRYGSDWANRFTTAHEAVPDNPSLREAMDLHNNSVGRGLARRYPNAPPEQLASLVQSAVTKGYLVVVSQRGRLEWSDQVPVGQHGLAAGPPVEGRLPVPPAGSIGGRAD